MPVPCIVCGNTNNNEVYEIPEVQLGLNEVFKYQLCGDCGTMQNLELPSDLGKYYPNEGYYSFNLGLTAAKKIDQLRKIKADYLLFGKQPILGRLFSIGYKPSEVYEWAKGTKAKYDDAILDVGTGNGSLLTRLQQIGFTNLTGIDPFINESVDHGNVKVLKKDIFEVDEKYDVVMMHHALEHVPGPKQTLKKIYEILKPGGRLLVRLPIFGNYGWKTYGKYWCGMDAPRHTFIPSEKGMKLLAEETGFKLENFYYDSVAYMIWCSEQYKKGISLYAPESYMVNKEKSMFTKEDIKRFGRFMNELNKKGQGDTAAFYLVK